MKISEVLAVPVRAASSPTIRPPSSVEQLRDGGNLPRVATTHARV
jgi:hypothetical protein